jgi:septum formation protein
LETATLRMRPLSDAYIESYLDQEWETVGGSVGVYRIEGPGAQLFESVEGSHWAVLGMPLLPLLEELRRHGILAS